MNFWWFVHNAIAHPLMGIFQGFSWPDRLHDWTAAKAFESMLGGNSEDDVELRTGHYVAVRPLNLEEKACLLTDLMGMKSALYMVEEELGLRGEARERADIIEIRDARGHFLDRFQVMLTEHFSEEEIDSLIEFYQSSVGRAYASKQAQTMKKMSDMMGRFVTELTEIF